MSDLKFKYIVQSFTPSFYSEVFLIVILAIILCLLYRSFTLPQFTFEMSGTCNTFLDSFNPATFFINELDNIHTAPAAFLFSYFLLPVQNVEGGVFSRITMTSMTSAWYLKLTHFEAVLVGLVVLQVRKTLMNIFIFKL